MSQHSNPDFDKRCNGCGQERYPDKCDLCDSRRQSCACREQRPMRQCTADVPRVRYLEAALRLISEGRGRFSRDELTHASNTIEDMKRVATDALVGTWEIPEDFDERCNECIERRYPEDEEPLSSGPGLYAMETHRMIEAQALKR